jgi:hypothetical protein
MTTDYRALCSQLADELHKHTSLYDGHESELVARARAALAQLEPEGPTDAELHQLWLDLYAFHDGPTSGDVAEIARAVLARWGRPAITPIPVSDESHGNN